MPQSGSQTPLLHFPIVLPMQHLRPLEPLSQGPHRQAGLPPKMDCCSAFVKMLPKFFRFFIINTLNLYLPRTLKDTHGLCLCFGQL